VYRLDQVWELPEREYGVLTVGELLIDLISADYEDTGEGAVYTRHFGGSPANIAMNLNKLGVRAQVASSVGTDRMGDFLTDRVRAAGLSTDLIQRVDHSTSMVLINKSKSSPVPVFYRQADHHLTYTEQLGEVLQRSAILHFSCWPISMQPARSSIEAMLEIAARHQLLIGFDPNYHPMLWPKDEDGVSYIRSIISKVDIVKPSDDDAARLFGEDTPERQVQKFLDLGAKLVILTRGEHGAIVSNGTEMIHLETMADEVVDTTGAGDAFWSGFYAGLLHKRTIAESLELGLAVSAYKLKHTGAVVDLPKLAEIKNQYGI
jgi:fructokinase